VLPARYNAAVDFIDRHVAQGSGERLAVRDDRSAVTYRGLAERVNRAGNALVELGVRQEDRVLLCALDTIDFVAVFWGAIKVGAVPIPVNTLLTSEDYAFFLTDSRARVLVVSDVLAPKLALGCRESRFLRDVLVLRTPESVRPPTPPDPLSGALALEPLLDAASGELDAAPTGPDDVAFWLYSSGSTGAPKGAVHLQSHLVHTAVLYGEAILGIHPDDVVFSAAKLFFAYGLGNAMTFPFHVGASSVLLAERPTVSAVLRVLTEARPTIFGGIPTLFASLLADPRTDDVGKTATLRRSVSAGEALPGHIGERWKGCFGTDILDGIGSTEMLHIFLSNRPGEVRYGTTGKPVPGYTLKLVGDDGEPVPDGEEGSLWVSGPSSAVAYWNQREKSLATFHGPWTRTGDRYVRDAEGYFTYSGRADDMLKVGGIWVSPFEVESALTAHPAVLEAAVVGHADDEGLVKPKAFVVLHDKATGSAELVAELKAFVKEKLAPYKYPRWIELVGELPKTATGKIQRYRLRG
jgi:benzoate-CoA ligase family protein